MLQGGQQRPTQVQHEEARQDLQVFVAAIILKHRPTSTLPADVSSSYIIPTHTAPINLRPDIVWHEEVKQLVLEELTISFTTSSDAAVVRKRPTSMQGEEKWFPNRPVLPLRWVLLKGVANLPVFKNLQQLLSLSWREREHYLCCIV